MCEMSNMCEYQKETIKKLWTTIYILGTICILLICLFTGLAIWSIKYFQSFEYIEETEYRYELDNVDIANINQRGGILNRQSNYYGNIQENEEEKKKEEISN